MRTGTCLRSTRNTCPASAPQSFRADSMTVSSTPSRSDADRPMTARTSLVAASCSRTSASSSASRSTSAVISALTAGSRSAGFRLSRSTIRPPPTRCTRERHLRTSVLSWQPAYNRRTLQVTGGTRSVVRPACAGQHSYRDELTVAWHPFGQGQGRHAVANRAEHPDEECRGMISPSTGGWPSRLAAMPSSRASRR